MEPTRANLKLGCIDIEELWIHVGRGYCSRHPDCEVCSDDERCRGRALINVTVPGAHHRARQPDSP